MLSFEESSHTYRWNGRIAPSVTQILSPLESFECVPADLLEAAREFGSHVHLAAHLDNLGDLDDETLSTPLLPYLEGWRAFKVETGFKVRSSEERLYHERYGYAGTPDAEGEMRNCAWVIDIKSGLVPATVGLQTAAYEELLRARDGRKRRRLCVQLTGDGRYKLFEQKDPADWSLFMSAKNLFHWLAKRKKVYAGT